MSGENQSVVQGSSGDGYLSLGAVLAHNNHLQNGQSTSARCGLCSEGLEGAVQTAEKARDRGILAAVAASDGADQEGDAPSPPGDGPVGGKDELLGERLRR